MAVEEEGVGVWRRWCSGGGGRNECVLERWSGVGGVGVGGDVVVMEWGCV